MNYSEFKALARRADLAKGEGEVREMLDAIWEEPKRGEEILGKALEKNKEIYKFERMLEESK